MGRGGARGLQDEKTLLAELGRLFHVARANVREQRGAHRPPPAARRGGSVWVVLKGGFARVPAAGRAAKVAHNSAFRGRLSERRRVEALEAAEAYVATAWQQAREAGLLLEDGSAPSGDEGLQYLREQYEVAASMLRRGAVGACLKKTVDQTVPGHIAAAAGSTPPAAPAASSTLFTTEEWAGIIARENVILKRFARSAAAQDDGDMILHEAAQVAQRYYFVTAEPLAPPHSPSAETAAGRGSGGGSAHGGEKARDVLPTKCIVRIRGSNRCKHTSILASTKAINYFRSNFMQVIRKELGSSKLPRGEDLTEGKQQQQLCGGNTVPDANPGCSSKKHTKKRQK